MADLRPVLFVLGMLLLALSAAMVVPAVADASAGNPDWKVFAYSAAFTFFAGGLFFGTSRSSERFRLTLRQGFLVTTVSWFGLSAFAALPFLFFGHGLDYADAVFEAVSGLTTTGSTVLVGLDRLPPGILLWRSVLQWIGGIGIIGMAIVLLPFLRVGGMQLFHMESSDRSEKVVRRPGELMLLICQLYLLFTVLCAIGYWLAGMTAFDAMCHAMTTIATGGYSTRDASFGHFGAAARWIAVVFMLLAAFPFVAYIRTIRRRGVPLWRDSQIRGFLKLLVFVCGGVTLWLMLAKDMPVADALRESVFNIVSIVTTTGYASQDYAAWGPFAVPIFFFLTFIGGCTGSTAGGIKIFRFQIFHIVARTHIRHLLRPHGVFVAAYQGKPLPPDIGPSVLAFMFAFLMSVFALAVGLAAFGLDFETALSGAATALANVGPGLGPVVGPAGNFASLPDGAKWLLSVGMLLGRLELFTVLVLFTPAFWRW